MIHYFLTGGFNCSLTVPRSAIARMVVGSAVILLVLQFLSPAFAQSTAELTSSAEIGAFVSSSDRTPFWLRANQWGRVPLASPAGTARLGFHYRSPQTFADTSRRKARLNWEFGAEIMGNAGADNKLLLPEAYAKLHWKHWELMAGREQQIMGIVDTTLSSGSLTWSGNAQPVPTVRLGLSDYVPLKFLWNFVSIKGSFAHSWFNVPYIQKAYLHQKTLYGRFGKPEGNVHVHLGLVHHVQWGGEAEYLKGTDLAVNGKLTTNFNDYLLSVVLAEIPRDKSNGRFTNFDGVNRIGNHVGHIDMAVDWKINKTKFLLYRQHPFEDASGFQFQNLPDGLYGLSLRTGNASNSFFNLNGIVAEYLYTKNQTPDRPGSRFRDGDNYFNHGQYIEGWSYLGRGLGTPFIPPQPEVRPNFPSTGQFFPSNRIIAYYLGLQGRLAEKVHFTAKVSYSSHYGPEGGYFNPVIRQFSSLLAFDAPISFWRDTRLKAQIAYDNGGVLPRSVGGYLGIKSYFRK